MSSFSYYYQAFRENRLCLYINTNIRPRISLIRREHLVMNLERYYSIMSSEGIWSIEDLLSNIINQRDIIRRATVISLEDGGKFIQFEFLPIFEKFPLKDKIIGLYLYGSNSVLPTTTIDFPLLVHSSDPKFRAKLEKILKREKFLPGKHKATSGDPYLPYNYIDYQKTQILKVTCLYYPKRAIDLGLALLHELLGVSPKSRYEVKLFED